jgi:hypothetical protein
LGRRHETRDKKIICKIKIIQNSEAPPREQHRWLSP